MNKKTALITGASRGIGRAIALTLAKNGYHVFLNCSRSISELNSVKSEIENIPGASCDLFVGDIGNSEFVTKMFEAIYKKSPPHTAFTPYRICPLGAHSDHQFGKITGLAIDKGIHIAYGPKQNGVIELKSLQF